VLDAQSASVDVVSEAPETSEAFIKAMEDILIQASIPELVFDITDTPEPTPETTPEPTAEPEQERVDENMFDSINTVSLNLVNQPMLRSDALSLDQARDSGYDPAVLGNSSVTRRQVRSIEFVNHLDGIGEDAWDVSAAKDNSAFAWMSGDKLIIAGKGGVNAPTDAGYLFAKYDRLESINFNHSFFTGETTNMEGMFYGCSDLRNLDLNDFDTGKVTDMSYMFCDCDSLTALDLSGQAGRSQSTPVNSPAELVNLKPCGFDTGSVTDLQSMFADCDRLTEIDMGDSFAILDANDAHMFENCRADIRLNDKKLSVRDWQAQASIGSMIDRNSSKDHAKWLQRILKKMGYLSDTVDGIIGNNTKNALRRFQADANLYDTGEADWSTLRELCTAAARVNFIILPEEKKVVKKKSTSSSGGGGHGFFK